MGKSGSNSKSRSFPDKEVAEGSLKDWAALLAARPVFLLGQEEGVEQGWPPNLGGAQNGPTLASCQGEDSGTPIIPATNVQSERLFPDAGNILTTKRASLCDKEMFYAWCQPWCKMLGGVYWSIFEKSKPKNLQGVRQFAEHLRPPSPFCID